MLGLRLRQARMQSGLAQRQVADALAVSYQQIQKFEAGSDRISAQALFKLAHLFGVGLGFFADETVCDANSAERLLSARMTAVFDSLANVADKELLFSIASRLAAALPTREEPTPATQGPAVTVAGVARILLVDDDADALRVTAAMLRRSGCDVTVASNGDVALSVLADTAVPFDGLVTDHAMPGLSGLELVKLVSDSNPNLPCLVVTGYGRDADLTQLPPEVRLLSKPFSRADLIERVAAMTSKALRPQQEAAREDHQSLRGAG